MVSNSGALGFPRMGPNREMKFALEKHWRGKMDEASMLAIARDVEQQAWGIQMDAGVGLISAGDHCLYDNMLAWTEYLGAVPKRHAHLAPGNERMFAMARGIDNAPALDMTKFFDTNYHYEVPELETPVALQPNFANYLETISRGIAKMGADRTAPVVLGPVTWVHLARHANAEASEEATTALKDQYLDAILPVYAALIGKLAAMGVQEVQLHEPALVMWDSSKTLAAMFKKAYFANKACPMLSADVKVNLVTFFEDVGAEAYQWVTALPVSAISLDFTRGDSLKLVKGYGFPKDKVLGAGIIDGRSPWAMEPAKVVSLVREVASAIMPANPNGSDNIRVQASCNLQFVPWDVTCEGDLAEKVGGDVLAFAVQKVQEIVALAEAVPKITAGKEAKDIFPVLDKAWKAFSASVTDNTNTAKRLAGLTEASFSRPAPFKERVAAQQKSLKLPVLPTTTIGSFPQTAAVRKLRREFKSGALSAEDYERAIDQQISYAIGIQEALGLDILVHGEAERTDMVEFFGQQFQGFAFTSNGWVQSYGSRCVRPPIIHGDVSRPTAMTTREFKVAQELTLRPVKGMLTGPVTILNWSFPRLDVSRKEQAFQIALAISDEVADLEAAGCKVIQVDEPALREGLPLKPLKKADYLKWATDSFLLSTAIAKPETSIHTHMCYCDFGDCMEAIDRLDADVNSIENARSDNTTLQSFKEFNYKKGLGPGLYDIHSPVVPPVSTLQDKLEGFLKVLPKEQLVCNPDCGLKTRTWPQVLGALRNLVEATRNVRTLNGISDASGQAVTVPSGGHAACCTPVAAH
ncbi:5-methyltetrahydropteroyltriglutamate--homocysteine S-methyltransferase [Ectocarpus siliculosus]|uniref:5-methyltetrahydropteroyltriglutamate--homocysteine S-methyltransferase n=1 Tax=Ectocarpus siliculosus TaxID=2880 RepID=D8LTQ6_ECTSI|nr:5-methyltetrahydropteroyltriglutamate--homocysteine S-methyltransferase [Ectocarpus siliculosus]|eukprot:CBN73953.1 5-methyltetrahydropteroyltriglutamate--homocysteine S-methyltransferase [Ectocarpus siliculosus]